MLRKRLRHLRPHRSSYGVFPSTPNLATLTVIIAYSINHARLVCESSTFRPTLLLQGTAHCPELRLSFSTGTLNKPIALGLCFPRRLHLYLLERGLCHRRFLPRTATMSTNGWLTIATQDHPRQATAKQLTGKHVPILGRVALAWKDMA
jgi:hypothetical protein